MKSSLFTILLLLSASEIFSQPFGNEWINYNQRYFKFKLAENGVYRIDAAELQQAGVPVSTVAAAKIKVFRRGQEIAINAVADNSGFLNYLEFYGEKNDGKSDSLLYTDPADQLHQMYNLFTDTASYFLTWNQTEDGKSIGTSNLNNNSGLTPEPYHINELIQLETNIYSSGLKFGFNSELSSGEYVEGEGWTGNFFTKNQSQTFTFNIGMFDNTGIKPTIEIGLVGGNSLQHLTEISGGPSDLSLRKIDTATFNGWTQSTFSGSLEWSDVALDGTCVIRVTALGQPAQADRISVAYIKLAYPQEFNMGENENKVLYQRTSTEPRSYLIVPTTNATGTRLLEITDPINPRFIFKNNYPDRFEFVVPDPSISRQFFAFTSTKNVFDVKEVDMNQIDPSNASYLIITHDYFHSNASDGLDPVLAYQAYRESASGGSFSVASTTIDEIFNQYGFGDPTSLAIRNFIGHALTVGQPQHLFIIGKGLATNFGFYRQDPIATSQVNYIPTFGFPGSDMLYTVRAQGTSNDPAIGVGRLNAFSPDDVKSYLDKVKEMEALPYNDLWRKNQLMLSGGQNSFEQQAFSNYVEDFKRLAEDNFLGGNARIRRKITTAPTEPIDIRTEINNGLNMLTLFGHSSSQNSDIEIGNVNDHNNSGKYPVILVNGCNAGEIFSTGSSFGEPWVNATSKGALAFVGHADFSFSSNLKRFSDLLYQEAFSQELRFGRSLGTILTSIATRYFELYGTSLTMLAQVHLMSVLGDPAIRIFGADQPDYESDPNQIFAEPLSGSQLLASQSAFTINLIVNNYGKTSTDSLVIEISRTLPDGEVILQLEKVSPIKYQDTVQIIVENDPAKKVDGNNQFSFSIDPNNLITELNENNNTSTFELFITNGNTINLYPIDLGVQSDKVVSFTFQPSAYQQAQRDFSLEYDTAYDFSSSFKSNQSITGQFLLKHPADFTSLPDSTTIYWRTRFSEPTAEEDTTWVNSSFTLINAQNSGWGQVGNGQYASNSFSGTTLNDETGIWNFLQETNDYQIVTHGKDHPNQYEDYQAVVGNVNYLITESQLDPVCNLNTINAIFIDRATGQPYRPINFTQSDVFNPLICGRIPQVIHNLTENQVLGVNRYLDSLISLMKPEDYVLLFSFDSVAFSNWDSQLISSLNTVGIQSATISSLVDGQPVIFLGKKGDAPGNAIEITNDGSILSPTEQLLTLSGSVNYQSTSGSFTTRRIGPAKSWTNLSYQVEDDVTDNFSIDVIGITSAGIETNLFSGARFSSADVSTIDPLQYPFLKLNVSFSDNTDLTPPQIKALTLEYQLPPEGILLPLSNTSQNLQEGESFQTGYSFINVSQEDFQDSLQVIPTLLNVNTTQSYNQSFNIAPTQSMDTTDFEVSYNTLGKTGPNNLSVRILSQENELLSINNFFNLSPATNVDQDITNPVLNVTFDGDYILDGDIISPNPNILITLKDENAFLLNEDTTGVDLFLRLPCDGCQFERVNFTDPDITYIPQSEGQDFELSYQPGPLEDGVYHLRVSAEDQSGNNAGDNDYEISFEVINETSVTHFYPYPNPFSTSTRFVFTLTGGTIPDEIKIQIMTITGSVVKEINQDEIGPVRIGNNITEYSWDGRDEYGDLLANGVYLYRVFIRQQGESLKHRFTTADKAFKNGYGKIYILR